MTHKNIKITFQEDLSEKDLMLIIDILNEGLKRKFWIERI